MERAFALALALFEGVFCLGWGRVADGVVIDGLSVGGMRCEEAERLLRERLSERLPPLVVRAPKGDLVLKEELTVVDNAAYLVRKAKKGERLTLSYSRNWASAEEVLYRLCLENAVEPRDAELHFSDRGFTYVRERTGISCDYHGLVEDVTRALAEGKGEVVLRIHSRPPAVTEEALRARTRRLSSCTTYFDGSNAARSHNIALAADRIAGTELLPGEEFSFNRTVGERTEENGFQIAAVIKEGEFVPGVGGGVCQASTTLYLAALKAGLSVTEARSHSLSVGYVPPSLDAMVSAASDLKFINPYPYPVYFLAESGNGSVTFSVYGMPDGRRYETESVTLATIPPPPPEEVDGEEKILRAEKQGIVSESYLLTYGADGALLSRVRLRRDKYAAVRGKISRPAPGTEDVPNFADPSENLPQGAEEETSDSADRPRALPEERETSDSADRPRALPEEGETPDSADRPGNLPQDADGGGAERSAGEVFRKNFAIRGKSA